MRFVFLSYNYSPDIRSPQEWVDRIRFYVGWLECLAKNHTVIRVDQINYEGEFVHNGVQYHFVNNGKAKDLFPHKLNRFVKNLQPDVVIISSFMFPLQLIQLRLQLGNRVKIVVQHHAEKPFTGAKKLLQNMASKKTDAGIFASMDIGKAWIKSGNLNPSMNISEIVGGTSVFYPTDKHLAKQKTNCNGAPVFLWVGRLNPNKDPLTAVKAFARFAEHQPAARLYMIYQTTELLPAIKELIPPHRSDAFVLIGKVEHNELLYWYNSADFYLSASHYEGSGTALCEAMSCGCIPVVSNIPSFRMINGNCGLLYEPGDVDGLFAALQQTQHLNMQDQRTKTLLHFKNQLSFEAIAIKFQEMVASL